MTRFYGSVSGMAETSGTRRGSARSGIYAHPRGWDLGVEVRGYANEDDDDEFAVTISGGSHAGRVPIGDALIVTDTGDGVLRIACHVGDHSFVTYRNERGDYFTRREDAITAEMLRRGELRESQVRIPR